MDPYEVLSTEGATVCFPSYECNVQYKYDHKEGFCV